MADIKTLIDRKTRKTIYPQTIARAIYDSYGKDLQTRLDELNQNYVATSAQVLTDAQKTQVRTNINAAPGGFGYGDTIVFKSWTDTDGSGFEAFVDQMIDGTNKIVRLSDLADYPANVMSGNGGFADIKIYDNGCVLVLFHGPVVVSEGSNDGVYHASKKRLTNGTWLPWEYDNPPMVLGNEYRTTEHYMGQPVFKYLFDSFETWRPDGQNGWASSGKAVLFPVEKGGTKNIGLDTGRTYIFSATDNVYGGVAIVQTMDSSVRTITPLVPLANWKIEAGSGLSVNVTDTDGRYGVTVSAMML